MSIAEEVARIQNAKTALKNAINAKGGTLTDELIDQYALAVNNLPAGGADVSSVTVTASDILAGKIAVNSDGNEITGTIPTVTASSDGETVTVPVGYIATEQTFQVSSTGYDTSIVTATADTMLSGVIAVGKNGETITGNIETSIPTVSANVFSVAKGYVSENTTLTVPEAIVTETETQATVSPGYVPQELSFELGKAGEEVQYGYINDDGLFQKLDLSGDVPTEDGDPIDLANAGVYATGVDEADYTVDYSTPLTFTSDEEGSTIALSLLDNSNLSQADFNDIYYRVNYGEWTKYTLDTSIEVGTSNKVQFWNKSDVLNRYGEITNDDGLLIRYYDGVHFKSTGRIGASGGIISMINYAPLSAYCYAGMFEGCSSLTAAPELPATQLAKGCYSYMFYGCTGLTSAPELPAITLLNACYRSMFQDCTSLTVAPELPATQLAKGCYINIFNGCSSLTTAPELPATELADFCYDGMFCDCSSLTTAPELPATTIARNCYGNMFEGCSSLTAAPELPATQLAMECYSSMFYRCSSLTTAPELPATKLEIGCYMIMFKGCTSLTVAPELPATTLLDDCYDGMFWGCTSLSSVTIKATSWQIAYPPVGASSNTGTESWLFGVSKTGTFYKLSALPEEYGNDYIPQAGWAVVNIDEEN